MSSTIPIIDLAEGAGDLDALARRLGDGFRAFGFVGVRGHGVEDAVVRAALDSARAFFGLPLRTKQRYEVAGGGGQRGYTSFGVEKAKDQRLPDLKEFWHVGRSVPRGDPLAGALLANLWPEELAGFKAAQLALFAALERTGARVLALVARHLGLPQDWFAMKIERGNSILRSIHYPPIGLAERMRAAAHEDVNLITLLVGSEEPGLEILTRGGDWIAVTTLPGTIVVNVGDMLERLTNDELPSTTHRVANPPPPWDARSRFSIPFFLHFDPDVVIETLPGCISPARPDRHPTPITAHKFLQQRLREIGLL